MKPDQRQVETRKMHAPHIDYEGDTEALEPHIRVVQVTKEKEPESANYRKDSREWGNRAIALVLLGALAVAGMVLRHELTLSEMNFKLNLVLKALKIEVP